MVRQWRAPWVRRALRRIRRPQLALIALVVAVGIGYGVNALDRSTSNSSATSSSSAGPVRTTVGLSTLPPQAAQTIALIKAGGPFPYAQDGVVFGNNEHLLPAHAHGYYHEYTVPTPGATDRATRRIVTGGGQFYYTDDHYESFRLINLAG